MSIESARTMIETAENDTALQKQLQTAEGPEAVLAIASEKGYEFTEEELLSVMQEKQLSFGTELSEEQLESVAGGWKADVSPNTNTDTGKKYSHNQNKRVGDVGGHIGKIS